MMKDLVVTMVELHHTRQWERSTCLSTYLGSGDALWMEAAEHSRQAQPERDLVCKAVVRLAWEEMGRAPEADRVRRWQEGWPGRVRNGKDRMGMASQIWSRHGWTVVIADAS